MIVMFILSSIGRRVPTFSSNPLSRMARPLRHEQGVARHTPSVAKAQSILKSWCEIQDSTSDIQQDEINMLKMQSVNLRTSTDYMQKETHTSMTFTLIRFYRNRNAMQILSIQKLWEISDSQMIYLIQFLKVTHIFLLLPFNVSWLPICKQGKFPRLKERHTIAMQIQDPKW